MNNLIIIIIPIIIISILIFIGLIILQVFLSKKESKWPGLILPGCSIIIALTAALSAGVFIVRGAPIITAILLFLFCSIPTLVYTIIYIIAHKKKIPQQENAQAAKGAPVNANQEIIKMNIQDLE